MTYIKTPRILLICIFLLCFSSQFFNADAQSIRNAYNFNHNWRVKVVDDDAAKEVAFSDDHWELVTLPYAWNEDEAFMRDIKDLSTGIAWYRKNFFISEERIGQKVFIEFEGVRQAAEVYVNGAFVGLHENGITAFGFDLTDLVKSGENVIAVKTNNDWEYREKSTDTKFQWSDKNFNANYGGIPKNVKLHFTGKVYQTLPLYSNLKTKGQYIYANKINVPGGTAEVHVESEVKNDSESTQKIKMEATIYDLDGKSVKRMKSKEVSLAPGQIQTMKVLDQVKDLHFWSWGYGYLYIVETVLKQNGKIIDKVITKTGFRKTEFGGGLIKLNDRVIMIKGYAQRTSNEWPAIGMSVPPWMSDYSNQLMIKSNGNLIRWMHTTPWKQDVESCDRVGMMQAMPAGDAEKDVDGRRWEQRKEVMRDAIIYYRNNPSIIFYECGNEGISENHMREMKNIRDEIDPFGGRAIGSREMLDSKEAEYGGEMLYINKSNDKPVWAMEYMRDEALRKYWDEYSPPFHQNGNGPDYKGRDGSAYNQNQDSFAKAAVGRWYDYYRERPGTGEWVSSGGVNIIFSGSNTHYRGTESYRRSGVTDPLRIPKDAFFAHQVMWNGWVDLEEHSSHIVGHWSYLPGTKKDVYVVSSGEKVELFLNNKSLGFGEKSDGFLFTFDSVYWKPGVLKAVSYDKDNKMVSTQQKSTAGYPAAIKLSLIQSPNGMFADGHDITIVEVEVVDSEGQRCPTALNIVDFKLIGAAEWRGGLAQGTGNYVLEKSLPVEAGINRVLIRSTTKPGEIHLIAKSEDLLGDSISFSTKAIAVEDGLSMHFPAAELPVNLEKGPTPQHPSFKTTRESIEIKKATAGANQQDAPLSYDGIQSTRWANDGTVETGWINYQFVAKKPLSEISLKLSGWRTRSYPIVVMANDEVIYQGITSPNLGYFYIQLDTPVETDNCKIRLFGPTELKDTYQLVEITGKLDKETAEDIKVQNPNTLNIVDVGFFTYK